MMIAGVAENRGRYTGGGHRITWFSSGSDRSSTSC